MQHTVLSALTDDDLEKSLLVRRGTERETDARVVEELVEVDRRKMYLRRACSNLTRYCVERLGYSHRAAGRRVGAARLTQRYPCIPDMLRRGDIDLSNLEVISPVLKAPEDEARLHAVAGKSRFEIERLVAGWAPQPAFEATTVEVVVDTLQAQRPAALPKPINTRKIRVVLCLEMEVGDDIEFLRDNERHLIPDGDINKVVTKALKERRKVIEGRKYGKVQKPQRKLRVVPPAEAVAAEEKRSPGRATRRAVTNLVGVRCCYRSDDGHRCSQTGWLEQDHIIRVADGGLTNATNLQWYCRAHNQAKERGLA